MPCRSCGGNRNRVRDLRSGLARIFCAACGVDHTEAEYRSCPKRLAAVRKFTPEMKITPTISATRVVSTPSIVRVRPMQAKGPIFRKSGLTLSEIPRRKV